MWRLFGLVLLCAQVCLAQDGVQRFAELGRCQLESGKVIEHCRIGYRTWGKLDQARTNTVLMPTWLYGTSANLASLFGSEPSGSVLVDTSHWFGIAIDALGNGVSSSPSNSTQQHGPDFPAISTADMVDAEYRVVTETLGLKHLHGVVGLSMGGEQAWMWAVRHGSFFDLAVPIISTPQLTVFDRQSKEIMLGAIRDDPGFHGGHYTTEPALKVANLYNVQAVTSPAWRNRLTAPDGFAAFLGEAEAPIAMDANDRVAQLQAVEGHDVLRGRSMEEVARATKPKFLIIVSELDRMVVPSQALRWAAITGAPTYISHGECAHLIMQCDAVGVANRVRSFLLTGALPAQQP